MGAVLPHPPLLEAARRKMSIDAYDCLYLSSVPEFLDAAKELGMATAYFAASPSDARDTSHPLVKGFTDILRSRDIGHRQVRRGPACVKPESERMRCSGFHHRPGIAR